MMPPFMAYKTGELVTLRNETEKREEGAGFSRSYRIKFWREGHSDCWTFMNNKMLDEFN